MSRRDQKQAKKLVLERKTLRTLDARALGGVAGGARKQDADDGGVSYVVGDIEVSRGRGTV